MEELEKKQKEPHIPWLLHGILDIYIYIGTPGSLLVILDTCASASASEVLREHLDQDVRLVSP